MKTQGELSTSQREELILSTPLGKSSNQVSSVVPTFKDLRILSLLSVKPMSVYELRKAILDSFGSSVSFGTLYPQLRSLEEAGLVSGLWEKRSESRPASRNKRVYRLTSDGVNCLTSGVEELVKTISTMQAMVLQSRTQ